MYQAHDGDKITLGTTTYANRFTAYSGQHLLGAGTSNTILAKGIEVMREAGYLILESMKITTHSSVTKAIISSDYAEGRIEDLTIKNCVIDGADLDRRAIYGDTGLIMGNIVITGTTF